MQRMRVLIVFQLAFQLQMVFVRVVSCLFFFAVYLDDLLYQLSLASVGCFWHWMFAGTFCFADDLYSHLVPPLVVKCYQ